MKPSYALAAALMFSLLAISPARAGSIFIDFDNNANGQAIAAPSAFDNASPLRNLYSALGVHFSGPGANQGGAILNDSTFTISARSGFNFLAFSAIAVEFVGPEKITFDAPVSAVSIFASGVSRSMTFTMSAFDAGGSLLDSSTLSTVGYSQLSVASSTPIKSVVFSAVSPGLNPYVFDDLAVTTVPEPSSALLLTVGALFLLLRRQTRPQ